MIPKRHKYIVDFFDVSILILVNAEKVDTFRKNFYINHEYLRQNGIEVIIISTEGTNRVLLLPDEYPFINWKIIFAGGDAAKTSAVKLNAGLQYASHRYVLIMGPDTQLIADSVYELRHRLYHYPQSFAVLPLPYHLLMAERTTLQAIGGFREWDDDRLNNIHIQRKLELAGQYKFMVAAAADSLLATDADRPDAGMSDLSSRQLSDILYPKRFDPRNQYHEGECSIGFDWTQDKSVSAVTRVLEKFEKFTTRSETIFQQQYGIICLLQIRNEADNIPGVLLHLDDLCDGIILLDDGSTDGSYEMADSDKLLIKVHKSNEGIFNDLGNRNLLLQLAYLFKAEWFFFIDADERFDSRCSDLKQLTQKTNADTIAFRIVHLWNTAGRYRKDIPEGNKGVIYRNRMFRNKGFMQIASEREIHFCATPFKHNRHRTRVLLLHYGLIDEAARMKKWAAYFPQDAGGGKQGYSYDFLLDKEIELGNIDDLV